MKIFTPVMKDSISGGFSWRMNFIKGVQGKAEIVDCIDDCDIFLISGVTMIDKSDFNRAKELGKKIVLRVDNVPRKSRNKRCSPHERLKE